MRDSDWSKKFLLRSDWSGPSVALITTVLDESILTMSPFKCSIVITTTCSIPVRITRTVLLRIRLVMNRKFACFHSLSLRITFGHPNPILLFFFHKKTIDAVTRIIGFCPVTWRFACATAIYSISFWKYVMIYWRLQVNNQKTIRLHVAINSFLHTHVNAHVFTCSNVAWTTNAWKCEKTYVLQVLTEYRVDDNRTNVER